MAMTKKEKAEFDAAIQRANTLAALRWTAPVERDVPIPKGPEAVSGWDANAYGLRVEKKWTSSTLHGYWPQHDYDSASKHGLPLFSTRLLALRALRYAVECEAADKLRIVDEAIAGEMK